MTSRLPERQFFPLDELEDRWKLTKRRLQELMISGHLVPSYLINHSACKVRFRPTEDDAGVFWSHELTGEMVEDDHGGLRHRRYGTDGFYYLLHPERLGGFDCVYQYFSSDRFHSKGADDSNICFMFPLSGSHPLSQGVTLDMAYRQGVVTHEEVRRFEDAYFPELNVDAGSNKPEEKPLGTTERNTLLKLVIGLAVRGYGYDPKANKSSIPKEIADDLFERGITVSDDTVRKYLKEAAAAFLPGNMTKN